MTMNLKERENQMTEKEIAKKEYYNCWTTVANVKDLETLSIDWFRINHEIFYSDLLEDNDNLPPESKPDVGTQVDRHFNHEEYLMLNNYLKSSCGKDLEAVCSSFQNRPKPKDYDSVIKSETSAELGGDHIIHLSKRPDYNLPFEVIGVLEYSEPGTTDLLPEGHSASTFLRTVFRELDLNKRYGYMELAAIAERISLEQGADFLNKFEADDSPSKVIYKENYFS